MTTIDEPSAGYWASVGLIGLPQRRKHPNRLLGQVVAASLSLVIASAIAIPTVAAAQDGDGTAQDGGPAEGSGTTKYDYETTPREEPENTKPPRDKTPEHSEGETGESPVAIAAAVFVGGLLLTLGYMWLRRRG